MDYLLSDLKEEIQNDNRHSVLAPLNQSEMDDFYELRVDQSSEELIDVLDDIDKGTSPVSFDFSKQPDP